MMNVRATLLGICCPIRWEFEEERLFPCKIQCLSDGQIRKEFNKYIEQFREIHTYEQSVGNLMSRHCLGARTRVCQMDKYIRNFEQIYLAILTNKFDQ